MRKTAAQLCSGCEHYPNGECECGCWVWGYLDDVAELERLEHKLNDLTLLCEKERCGYGYALGPECIDQCKRKDEILSIMDKISVLEKRIGE